MKIVKPNKIGIQQAVAVLRQGGVVIYPTDTAYAIGGIFDSKKVTQRILKIKKRKDEKFTLIASSLTQVEKFFKLSSAQKKLAKKFWPGPLSIVVSSRFAVRVPNNIIAQTLAYRAGQPLIATSANISGKQTLYDSKKIIKQFANQKNQPELILDAGRLPKTKTSTIIKVLASKIEVLRPGSIKLPPSLIKPKLNKQR